VIRSWPGVDALFIGSIGVLGIAVVLAATSLIRALSITKTVRSLQMEQAVRVGIAGLGRSEGDIHARVFERCSKMYNVVAVGDPLVAPPYKTMGWLAVKL